MSTDGGQRTVAYGSSPESVSRWIHTHARPGDVVCDLDSLIAAIQPDGTNAGEPLIGAPYTAIAVMMREGLICFLEDRPGFDLNIWIASRSEDTARHLARRIGARVAYVTDDYALSSPPPARRAHT